MSTRLPQARTRVRTEQDAVTEKLAAYETFIDRVEALSTAPAPSASSRVAVTGMQPSAESSAETRRCEVRAIFAETIRPHSTADVDGSEPLLATLRTEFTDSIAVALAPTTDAAFTADVKRALLSEASARRTETEAVQQALSREARHLEAAGETVEGMTAWIAAADETPLTSLGFERLQRRHEALAGHRARCQELAERRQAFLQQTTNRGADAGIHHRRLAAYLYEAFPTDHPLLGTVARLDAVCAECQRAVRQHLTRRA